ncbi:MAG: pilus assembly PilX N-terminal domain-containing protein [Candidatus Moranbacteria bacterium]|nr:pilus assembly PilX N-terminal domain-containing protein [Candidatus Moranbacteria bacterium]
MKQKQSACPPERRGSGLIFAVVLLFVILGMVITLSSVTVLETKMSQKTKSSVGAFYNSESGVEWALNKIATGTGPNISNIFGASFSGGKVTCPNGFGCELYLLDDQGKVITSDLTVDQVKAVRSVGTQAAGGAADTQRAIEAAVAVGGGGCYVSYGTKDIPAGTAMDSTGKCLAGFTNKGDIGSWGYCFAAAGNYYAGGIRPPGGTCTGGMFDSGTTAGQAFVCCQ